MSENSQEEGIEENHGEIDDRPLTNGWSMTVGELKAALKDIEDDYEVFIDLGDCEINTAHLSTAGLFRPSLGSNGLFILDAGQVVSTEYGYHSRMDVDHSIGCNLYWNGKEWGTRGDQSTPLS